MDQLITGEPKVVSHEGIPEFFDGFEEEPLNDEDDEEL